MANPERLLLVRDLMTAEPLTLGPGDNLARLYDLMSSANVRHVPIVEEGEIVGLVSHRDLLRCALGREPELPRSVQQEILKRIKVGEIMTTDVETAEPDWEIRIAAQLMFENKYGCLPVADGTRLVGILTESDFVRYLAGGPHPEPAVDMLDRPHQRSSPATSPAGPHRRRPS